MSIDREVWPFYLAAAIAACWLSTVVRASEKRRTLLELVLRGLSCGLMVRVGWLLVEVCSCS